MPRGRNVLNYVPIERHLERVSHTLDWLDQRVEQDGFFDGSLCLQDVVLACLLLWTESRGPIAWRGRPGLEAIVAKLERRASFAATVPQPLDL